MPRRTGRLRPDEVAAALGSAVVRTADLEAIGVPRSTISQRCRPGGPWRSLAPGLILLGNRPPSRDDRRRGALLHGGEGSVITGLDALALSGLHRIPTPHGPVHLLIPIERRRTSHGLALVERTARLPEPVPGRWPLAPVNRAVLDFCRRNGDRDQVRSAIAEAVQRGYCTSAQLAVELAEGSRRGRGLPNEVMREVADGVRSVAEAKTREWHLSPEDHDRTLERRSRLVAAGVVVVQTRPSRLQAEPAAVVDNLRRSLEQAARRPRPPAFAVPAHAPNGTFAHT